VKDPSDLGYDEPIGWPEEIRAAFRHGATVSPEQMERRRQCRRHHTVPIYLQRLFTEAEQLHAINQETKQAFQTAPHNLFCEKGANTVVDEDGKLRSDVEGVFAYIDSRVSTTVKRIVEVMRLRRIQLTKAQRTPDEIDLTLDEANQWELDAVALWCSQRKRNPHNPDLEELASASKTVKAKMLFNLWRVTLDQGAVDELWGERELTVGVALGHGFVVGDELANLVETDGRSDRLPVIPIARDVCLLWRRRPPERSGRWFQFEWLDDALVDTVNSVTAARSRVIAGPCRAQLERVACIGCD